MNLDTLNENDYQTYNFHVANGEDWLNGVRS